MVQKYCPKFADLMSSVRSMSPNLFDSMGGSLSHTWIIEGGYAFSKVLDPRRMAVDCGVYTFFGLLDRGLIKPINSTVVDILAKGGVRAIKASLIMSWGGHQDLIKSSCAGAGGMLGSATKKFGWLDHDTAVTILSSGVCEYVSGRNPNPQDLLFLSASAEQLKFGALTSTSSLGTMLGIVGLGYGLYAIPAFVTTQTTVLGTIGAVLSPYKYYSAGQQLPQLLHDIDNHGGVENALAVVGAVVMMSIAWSTASAVSMWMGLPAVPFIAVASFAGAVDGYVLGTVISFALPALENWADVLADVAVSKWHDLANKIGGFNSAVDSTAKLLAESEPVSVYMVCAQSQDLTMCFDPATQRCTRTDAFALLRANASDEFATGFCNFFGATKCETPDSDVAGAVLVCNSEL